MDRCEVYSKHEDYILAQECVHQDKIAIEHFLNLFTAKVWTTVRSKSIPESDREDVVQDILMRLIDSLHNYKGEASLNTFVYHVVHNGIWDYYRKSYRRKRKDILLGVTSQYVEKHIEYDPWKDIIDGLTVGQYIEYMSEVSKSVVLLYIDGYDFHQVADILDIGYEATRSRYKRGVQKVRDKCLPRSM